MDRWTNEWKNGFFSKQNIINMKICKDLIVFTNFMAVFILKQHSNHTFYSSFLKL